MRGAHQPVWKVSLALVLWLIALFLSFCGAANGSAQSAVSGQEQASVGLKFVDEDKAGVDKERLGKIYDQAMAELPPGAVPQLTTVHIVTPGMSEEATRISYGRTTAEIWLAGGDPQQFARELSLLVFLRKNALKVQKLGKKLINNRKGGGKP